MALPLAIKTVGVLASSGFKVISANSGKILAVVGLGEIVSSAWDWMTGDDNAEKQQDLIEELQSIRSELATPGLDLADAQKLAVRDDEIRKELESMGIIIEADFDDPQSKLNIQENLNNAQAAGLEIPVQGQRSNINMADARELAQIKEDMQRVLRQFGGRETLLPKTLASLKNLMSYDRQQLELIAKALS
jgi:hypothetical protein